MINCLENLLDFGKKTCFKIISAKIYPLRKAIKYLRKAIKYFNAIYEFSVTETHNYFKDRQ